MPLTDGEEIKAYLYGDSFTSSSNIFERLFAFITRILYVIFGIAKRKHIFVTNKRIISVDFQKILWFINNGIEAKTHIPRSIKNFGYTRKRSLILFITHYFNFNDEIIKSIGGKKPVYEMIAEATDLSEKVSKFKEKSKSANKIEKNDKALAVSQEFIETAREIKELLSSANLNHTSLLQSVLDKQESHSSNIGQDEINECLLNLKWQTHYLKEISGK